MIKYQDKVKGCLLLASLFETIGFNNGLWEFNYDKKIESIEDGILMNSLITSIDSLSIDSLSINLLSEISIEP